MAQSIRRGSKPRRAPTRARKAAKRPSMLSRAAAASGIRPETVQRVTTWSLIALVGGAAVATAHYMGLPAAAGVEIAKAVGRAGFEVKTVDIRGLDRMERLTVYAIALDQQSMAMPLVDLEQIRGRLIRHGWIEDARVSRRLPDTLVVDIVEREPAAIWQHDRKLALIDANGVVLEPVKVDAMPDLPLVIGPQANLQTPMLTRLLESAPALKPMLAGATWIGGRRWDLRFQSGEILALPEGEAAAEKALVRFARMDGADRLLGRGFVRFDMRDPTRFVVRVDRDRRAIDQVEEAPAEETPAPRAPVARLATVSDTI